MIVFDLDGTLVDSAPEIRAALEHAWEVVVGREVPFPQERFRIGPPLLDTIAAFAPRLEPAQRDAIAAAFRVRYDASDFSGTRPYPGVLEVLEALAARGASLAVATNKRRAPTLAILERWFAGRFPRVACLDGVSPEDGTVPGDKASMLRWLTAGAAAGAVLVGDTPGDVSAARAVGARAVAVTWGYEDAGTLAATRPDHLVHDAASLLEALVHEP
jgi:phosphoglycolate phosphatase